MTQEPKVIIKKDGPYLVFGKVPLIDEATNKELPAQEVAALCRCGHSKTKPFCDWSHLQIWWKAE